MTDRFQQAIQAFDLENRQDTRLESDGVSEVPKEYLYAQRMSEMLQQYRPDASEAVQLAARSQHIRRWEIPRDSFPAGRAGYREWRTGLAKRHAEIAGKIMDEVGYNESEIATVQALLQKKDLKTDPDCQLLEDVIGLVFVKYYFRDFAAQHTQEKLASILRKTMVKMSAQGREAALELDLDDETRTLIDQCLAES